MGSVRTSEQNLGFDPQEIATPTNVFYSGQDLASERGALLRLLAEYTKHVDELTKALDQARQRRVFTTLFIEIAAGIVFLATIAFATVQTIGRSPFFLIIFVLATLALSLLAAVPTLRIYTEQGERIKLLQRDLGVAAKQLERVVEVAASAEQHAVSRSIERLEFNLRLTDAESKLRYIGAIK